MNVNANENENVDSEANGVRFGEILKHAELPAQLVVEDERELQIEDGAVVDGEPKKQADKHELLVLGRRRIEPAGARLLVVHEHACHMGQHIRE